MAKFINARLRQPRDSKANWDSKKDLVLLNGERVFVDIYDDNDVLIETKEKIGDGNTTFENLPYFSISSSSGGLVFPEEEDLKENPTIEKNQLVLVPNTVTIDGVEEDGVTPTKKAQTFYSAKVGNDLSLSQTTYLSNLKSGDGWGSVVQVEATTEEHGGQKKDNDGNLMFDDNGEPIYYYPQPIASGQRAVALGKYTVANGDASMAVNYNNKAEGKNSFASGIGTIARGIDSLSAGALTAAYGNYSASFGEKTRTGEETDATGAKGHSALAIGRETAATGQGSLAGGYKSQASGQYSLSFGSDCGASGKLSMALGTLAKASNEYSIAMGYRAEASGKNALALGGAVAVGENSFAFGHTYNNNTYCTAAGKNSISLGLGAKAEGEHAFVAGSRSVAIGKNSVALGANNITTGAWSLAAGTNVKTLIPCSSALGYQLQTGIEVAESDKTTPYPQIVLGKFNKPSNTAAFQIGWGEYKKNKNVFEIDIVNNEPIYNFGDIGFNTTELSTIKNNINNIDSLKDMSEDLSALVQWKDKNIIIDSKDNINNYNLTEGQIYFGY